MSSSNIYGSRSWQACLSICCQLPQVLASFLRAVHLLFLKEDSNNPCYACHAINNPGNYELIKRDVLFCSFPQRCTEINGNGGKHRAAPSILFLSLQRITRISCRLRSKIFYFNRLAVFNNFKTTDLLDERGRG